ncbi:hypothetical protein DSCO28_50310 [Desulfosarcina ovata subsp. sediminis]|uniref:Uncharacterized protein n=1 Tax=Desulfosarcina ovata subsp. sediminis TaxID=885957 RepID=A0A5K7ZW30_9BACT|nr:hypothetical protein [Desulfosarcina ovata]BBO84465.1 hypothetical protein DSCO28_50310 [Desulfosarcina ovata subsp. sediminis]
MSQHDLIRRLMVLIVVLLGMWVATTIYMVTSAFAGDEESPMPPGPTIVFPDGAGGGRINGPLSIGGANALTWVPDDYDFDDDTARDAYFTSNPTELVDGVKIHLKSTGFMQYYDLDTTSWITMTALTKGPTGPAGEDGQDGQDGIASAWVSDRYYTAYDSIVGHSGVLYTCTQGHLSSSATEPGVGASWETAWSLVTGSGTDPNAIHVATSGEISGITGKTTPVDNDSLLIEDSESSNDKKALTLGNLWANNFAAKVSSIISGLSLGTASQRAAEDAMTDGSNLPDGAAVIAYLVAQGYLDSDDIDSTVQAYSALLKILADNSGSPDFSGVNPTFGDISGSSVTIGSTNAKWSSGTGSPEGVVTGNPGDQYSRTDGGTGTSFYVKETGSSTNTGWVAYGSGGSGEATTYEIMDTNGDVDTDLSDGGTAGTFPASDAIATALGLKQDVSCTLSDTGDYCVVDSETRTAGEAITVGQHIYISSADNKWYLADADASGEWPAIAVAAATVSADASLVGIKEGTMMFASSTFTAGQWQYLSDATPGGRVTTYPATAGDCVQPVGLPESDRILKIHDWGYGVHD